MAYVLNEKKTDLNNVVEYAFNPEKDEQHLFECVINCDSKETAYQEMMDVKEQFGKTGGVLGYHVIQSFKPDEITPEQAHGIGQRFAEQCFGDRYQAVVGTHLDRRHLHNHIIINSVSYIDGHKYRNNFKDYFGDIRGLSDALCREYGLSIIESDENGKAKHYVEWQAEKHGNGTWRGFIKKDVDEAIRLSPTFTQFIHKLREMGYEVKTDVKHIAVRPQSKERFVRLRSLGDEYSEEAIKRRIKHNEEPEEQFHPENQKLPLLRKRYLGSFNRRKRSKIKGIRALYFRYLFQMGILRKHPTSSKRTAFLLREDLLKLNSYIEQAKLLNTHHIETIDQLHERLKTVKAQMVALTENRTQLYRQKRNEKDEVKHDLLSQEQSVTTEQLKCIRKEIKNYEEIKARCVSMQKNLHLIRLKQYKQVKQIKRDDPQR